MTTDRKDKYVAYGALTFGLIAVSFIGTIFYKAIKASQ